MKRKLQQIALSLAAAFSLAAGLGTAVAHAEPPFIATFGECQRDFINFGFNPGLNAPGRVGQGPAVTVVTPNGNVVMQSSQGFDFSRACNIN